MTTDNINESRFDVEFARIQNVTEKLRAILGPEGIMVGHEQFQDANWPLKDPYWIPGDDT